MRITIELETSDGMVSPFENKLVAYIAGELHNENTPVAETPKEEEKPAPKRKRATRAKKKEEAPKEEAPKEEPKDLKDLLAHATILASEMMQNEDVALLKRILTTVGAKRVSTMTEEQTTRFIELAEEANYA